jgi:small-conductance mechanosensitive channel
MFEGDSVRFSYSTSGTIAKMGWFETMIQNSDDVVVGVPNSQLTGQRVYNLSRTPNSQVKQTLRRVAQTRVRS